MQGVQGSITITDSTFRSNIAFTAGGALAVSEGKAVSIANSTFSNNILLWRDLAAGGGFYCFLCNSVNITSSCFDGNRAVYGGGVALLQPWQPSVITNTLFVQNVALSMPLDNTASNRQGVSFPDGHGLFSGRMAAILQQVGGQAEAMDILGPIAANVTGDSGYYIGGGGLYVSLSSGVRLERCVFLTNSAHIGGEGTHKEHGRVMAFALLVQLASITGRMHDQQGCTLATCALVALLYTVQAVPRMWAVRDQARVTLAHNSHIAPFKRGRLSAAIAKPSIGVNLQHLAGCLHCTT
jgi:hypothetical protein